MQLSEITYRAIPDSIGLHGAERLHAEAESYQGTVWVALGEMRDGRFRSAVNLFMSGPDAAAKAARLADAINGAMVETAAPALAHAAE